MQNFFFLSRSPSAGARSLFLVRREALPDYMCCVVTPLAATWRVAISLERVPYGGKLSREKSFADFEGLSPSAKVFSSNKGALSNGCTRLFIVLF